ncbi:polyprenyl synthetase family protein [Calorimonas adulescens]|uniref:polyprenyl synthetase family protein n=1 Tax=Calorimonas adulescens TaxID=2606906 RepID=UPI001EEFD591|nr:farnesyl diphosphate synthase [Calorimonas adulescens]
MVTERNLDFKEEFQKKLSIIEDGLKTYLPHEDEKPEIIHQAMRYSVSSGGKRIRPILAMATYEMFDRDVKYILPVACAIEYIHTYSLIHDDLPAMDNDDFRRGKPTSHRVFGEAIAILAGDALLTHAFNVIYESALTYSERMKLYVLAGKEIAEACDSKGLVGGQVIDINSVSIIDTSEKLMDMDIRKTGCLIRASVVAGAIIGGAGSSDILYLNTFGEKLGLAFQVQDDILDYKENEIFPDKPTYTSILGIEGAREYVKKLSKDAIDSLNIFGDKAAFLRNLTMSLIDRKA